MTLTVREALEKFRITPYKAVFTSIGYSTVHGQVPYPQMSPHCVCRYLFGEGWITADWNDLVELFTQLGPAGFYEFMELLGWQEGEGLTVTKESKILFQTRSWPGALCSGQTYLDISALIDLPAVYRGNKAVRPTPSTIFPLYTPSFAEGELRDPNNNVVLAALGITPFVDIFTYIRTSYNTLAETYGRRILCKKVDYPVEWPEVFYYWIDTMWGSPPNCPGELFKPEYFALRTFYRFELRNGVLRYIKGPSITEMSDTFDPNIAGTDITSYYGIPPFNNYVYNTCGIEKTLTVIDNKYLAYGWTPFQLVSWLISNNTCDASDLQITFPEEGMVSAKCYMDHWATQEDIECCLKLMLSACGGKARECLDAEHLATLPNRLSWLQAIVNVLSDSQYSSTSWYQTLAGIFVENGGYVNSGLAKELLTSPDIPEEDKKKYLLTLTYICKHPDARVEQLGEEAALVKEKILPKVRVNISNSFLPVLPGATLLGDKDAPQAKKFLPYGYFEDGTIKLAEGVAIEVNLQNSLARNAFGSSETDLPPVDPATVVVTSTKLLNGEGGLVSLPPTRREHNHTNSVVSPLPHRELVVPGVQLVWKGDVLPSLWDKIKSWLEGIRAQDTSYWRAKFEE